MKNKRSGAATVELAIVLPILMFLLVISMDYGRLFYFSQIVNNCARNAALWAGDPIAQTYSPYTTLQAAANADAYGLDATKMNVSQKTGSDSAGSWVEVTVTYPFNTITNFPGVPSKTTLTSVVHVKLASTTPKGN